MNKRTETELFYDILQILIEQGNTRRASLLNRANVNYVKGQKILKIMSELGWITIG